jgi:Ca2+-binding RTX toxin-like protein
MTVTDANDAPIIGSNGGGASASVSIAENGAAVTTVSATDADTGTTLVYSLGSSADAGKFTIDAATGALSFKAAPDFDIPGDAGGDNVYDVVVRVSDGTLTDTQAIAVTVTNVNETPVITTNGGSPAGTVSVAENGTAVTTVVASDPDAGTALRYTITGGADAALFTIDQVTGALTFRSAPNFEAPGDAGANNVFDVTVTASDGTLSDTQALAVTVTNANEAPVITSDGGGASASLIVDEKLAVLSQVQATDPDAVATLAYSIDGGADAALFAIDHATGQLRFLAQPNVGTPQDAGGDNIYDVVVKASDGALSDTQAFSIEVWRIINGTPGTDTLGGTADADHIFGLASNDALNGLAGNDVLDGGAGNDTMSGGLGDDTYYVDAASDKVIELAGQGSDTVFTSVTKYILGSNIENLTFASGGLHSATGSAVANVLTGNSGKDTLLGLAGDDTLSGLGGADTLSGGEGDDRFDGGTGADKMLGGAGNDTFVVDNIGDRATEAKGKGTDTAEASISWSLQDNVENLILTGTGAINGSGNKLDNVLTGNAGANVLNGAGGNDILTGGLGADHFLFATAPNATINVDTVTDFSSVEGDVIDLRLALFAKRGLVGDLKAAAFHTSATAIAAHDADDRIIYNTSTGKLYYDADGLGGVAAVQIATFGTALHPALAYTDFNIVA